MTQFGERLKAARQKRQWTQKAVAQALATITDVAYGDYERGRNFPTPDNLRLLCALFPDDFSFDEMDHLIEQEKKQGQQQRAEQRTNQLLQLRGGRAAPLSGSRSAFVVNTGQDVPMTLRTDPVLSSKAMITLRLDLPWDQRGAKLDVIDLRSVQSLKTFDLPVDFLSIDVADNPAYKPLLAQMKQKQLSTLTLSKSAFAYRIWWAEEQPGE